MKSHKQGKVRGNHTKEKENANHPIVSMARCKLRTLKGWKNDKQLTQTPIPATSQPLYPDMAPLFLECSLF